MKNRFNPDIHHRRSIRLKDYDYAQEGAYFVTIVTQERRCLFGEIKDGKLALNDAGRMIQRWYVELVNKFTDIRCDAFVCMPNHTHFIIVNVGADLCVRPNDMSVSISGEKGAPVSGEKGAHAGAPLPGVVQWFKTMTTNEYLRGVKQFEWPPFPGKLWQRNYFEHIIRNDKSLNHIRQYILENPARWPEDAENPARRPQNPDRVDCRSGVS